MNDNPGAVKILYGTVFTENDVLQELSNQMVDYFAEKGKRFTIVYSVFL